MMQQAGKKKGRKRPFFCFFDQFGLTGRIIRVRLSSLYTPAAAIAAY
jgi:hypothetical protein